MKNVVVRETGPSPLGAEDCTESIVDRFIHVAKCVPGAKAVDDGATSFTYEELDERSNALAQTIIERSRSHTGLVAVVVNQDALAVVAILGILKAGLAYTFLDLTMPRARLGEISTLARPDAFVTDPGHEALAVDLAGDESAVVLVDAASTDRLPPVSVTPDDAAHVVFTSGSTGTPKGVVVPHGAYVDHARAAVKSMDFRPEDRMGLVLPVGFAAASLYLYRGLLTGAEIHLYDPRQHGIEGVAGWLRDKRITYLDLTPTMMRAFTASLDAHDTFEDLRVVTTAGEPVSGVDVTALSGHLPPSSLFVNHAGSSETSGYASYTVPLNGPVPEGQVPSGVVLGDRILTVRRSDGTAVQDEEPGELFVTSRFVAIGYWGQPELTAERFETLADGRRCFRTGDHVVLRKDGVLEHKGRRDQMVKVRGYLVEPSEVETALLGTGEANGAVVVGRAGAGGRTELAAWVIPSGQGVSPASVRRALREKVPNYMVPTSVVLVDDLPRNANGKVDRRALRDLPVAEPLPPVPPRDPVELQLAVTWADILGLESIGIDDDFFELGGDSLAAETAMTAVCDDFGVTLPTSVLLEAPTVAELAVKVRDPRVSQATSIMVALRKTGTRPPLFCVAGVAGVPATYLPISLYLGSDQPFYVLQNQGLENRGLPDFSIKGAAKRAIRSIRSVQPTGPYLLAGHSWGGVLAYEIARQLTASGQEVAFLGLLDVIHDWYPGETADPPWQRARADAGEKAERPTVSQPPRSARLKKVRGRLARLGLVGRVVIESLSGKPRTDERVEVFGSYGTILMRHYRRPPWKGPATVVTALDQTDGFRRVTWEGILLDAPHRCSVPGNHRSLLREPNARALADVLSLRIEDALDARQETPTSVPTA
jgi:amino acid adenylation domain-containing protein